MIALPTVSEVVQALRPFGARVVSLEAEGPRGMTRIECLEREVDGEPYLSQSLPETEHMPWSTFNSICRQLAIDPKDVQLSIPRPPTWWMDAGDDLPAN